VDIATDYRKLEICLLGLRTGILRRESSSVLGWHLVCPINDEQFSGDFLHGEV